MKKKNSKKKKIGIFTGYYLPHLGGVERYTEKLIEQLQALNYEIVIVTSNHDDLKSLEVRNVKIYRLPIHSLFKQRYPLPNITKEWKLLYHKIEKENFDFIICNTRFHLTTMIGAKLAKKQCIPAIVIEHGSNHFTVNNKVLDYFGSIYEHCLTNYLKKYISHFYGVSYRCNEWLKHFKINAKDVLYNAIDDQAYDYYKEKHDPVVDKNKIVITFAGRLIKEKGIYLLLDAFQNLKKRYSNIQLIVAGNGPILDHLKNSYQDNDIIFRGKLPYDKVMALYNDTDIFVHPSMFPEGLPTAILEAGIMKCAIIATDRGGTVEVINQKDYGIIMEENRESLEAALVTLIENEEQREHLKSSIHNRILEQFTWKITAQKVSKVLEDLKNEK